MRQLGGKTISTQSLIELVSTNIFDYTARLSTLGPPTLVRNFSANIVLPHSKNWNWDYEKRPFPFGQYETHQPCLCGMLFSLAIPRYPG